MCGIAGSFSEDLINNNVINLCLSSMVERGPDNQNFLSFKFKKKIIYLLHSRLSILDLNKRSNQPMSKKGFTLIFNGEIYNYKELKKDLEKKNYKFKTSSDTEVILNCFIHYREKAFNLLDGMWAIIIWDDNSKRLYFSRDKFGEKPLYYFRNNKSIYFASQIKQIQILSQTKTKIDNEKIRKFLLGGYKSVFKDNKNFFKKIKTVEPGHTYIIEKENIHKIKNWKLNYKPNNKLSIDEIISNSRNLLINSVKKQLNADRSVSILLSGGVDSAGIASIAHKVLNKRVSTYSIINEDKRYDESKNIEIIKNDLGCENNQLNIKEIFKYDLIEELEKLIQYKSGPILTSSSFVGSFLHKLISKDGHKVSLSGVGADEIYTGYYDHYLFYLNTQKKNKIFNTAFQDWEKSIKKFTRNPFLKNPNFILKNKNFRRHIFYTNPDLINYFKIKKKIDFFEKKFSQDVLRNRMLNELFYETVPKILSEDDNNNMINSIENRSPYLDKNLCEFMFSVPTKYLIKNGFNKYILRESLKEICNKNILQDKIKMGFNATFTDLFNFSKNKKLKNLLLDPKSSIYNIMDYKKIQNLITKKVMLNSESKFIFDILNCKIFMDLNS